MANDFLYSYECVISGTSATIDLLSQAPLPGGPVALTEDTPNDALLSLSELGYFEGADPTSTGFTYLGTFTTMGGATIVFVEVNGETFAYADAGLIDDDVSPGDDSLQILNFAQTDFVLCFCAGTMIETPGGPVPVERLRVDDLVVVESKSPMPIRWIGRQLRVVDQQRNHAPVRISAGALGDGVPSKDLFLSADHAVLVDGILVTARSLAGQRFHDLLG